MATESAEAIVAALAALPDPFWKIQTPSGVQNRCMVSGEYSDDHVHAPECLWRRAREWEPPVRRPRARNTDPDTSHEAAASVQHIRESQEAVLATLRRLGGRGTHEQIVDAYQGPHQSPSGIRTRCCECVVRGRVRNSGDKVKMRTGRRATVWELID